VRGTWSLRLSWASRPRSIDRAEGGNDDRLGEHSSSTSVVRPAAFAAPVTLLAAVADRSPFRWERSVGGRLTRSSPKRANAIPLRSEIMRPSWTVSPTTSAGLRSGRAMPRPGAHQGAVSGRTGEPAKPPGRSSGGSVGPSRWGGRYRHLGPDRPGRPTLSAAWRYLRPQAERFSLAGPGTTEMNGAGCCVRLDRRHGEAGPGRGHRRGWRRAGSRVCWSQVGRVRPGPATRRDSGLAGCPARSGRAGTNTGADDSRTGATPHMLESEGKLSVRASRN
jgi:hypothetical protein